MRKIALTVLIMIASVTFAYAQGGEATTAITADQLARLERAETRLKDWPNLARYREANSKLAPPAKDEDRVVFLGDSITDSWKLAEYFPGKPYVNRGISGQTTPQMLIRFRPDEIALNPKVVVILAGTNDLAGNIGPMTVETIAGNLASPAELARVNNIKVVIASVLPISDYNKNNKGKPIVQSVRCPFEQILALNRWSKITCRKTGRSISIIFPLWPTKTASSKWNWHGRASPERKGLTIMRPLAEHVIKSRTQKETEK